MICDLFLRTFSGDHQWIPFLLRSMTKHVRGFRKLIVVQPEGQAFPNAEVFAPLVDGESVRAIRLDHCPVYPDDYIGQQISKMRSWEYSDADEICFLDSDLVFVREFTPDTNREYTDCGYGDLVIEGRTWESLGTDQATCWRKPTADLLGQDPPFETMARHPFQYSRSMIQRCYNGIGGEAALLKFDRINPFSEFNPLGNWAILREGAEAVPIDLQARPDVVKQFWSHAPIAECEAELRSLGVWEG